MAQSLDDRQKIKNFILGVYMFNSFYYIIRTCINSCLNYNNMLYMIVKLN